LEQLKTGLKTKKTDCAALLANYQCGQNEILSVPSGDIIQPNVGDEIAINSIGFEVVELDGSGNGRGIVKVPMFQNAKFGVKFKGIKVAKGGCVVAGQAELSNVDVALLNEEQRKKLAETYEAFNKVLDVVDANAEGIAETFNSVWALMDGIKDRAAKIAAKLSGGQNPTAKEIKDLAKLTENSAAMLQKSLNDIKKQAQANADAGKVDEMQKIIDQQKASAKALLASAKDIKMGKDKLPTPQDPMEKANTQKQVDALAMTNGADVKKKLDGLKGTSNLKIEYNKIDYVDGKTITISNKEAVSGFTLKNVIEGENLAWVVKDGDKVLNNFTANPVGLMWPDGTTKLTLEATQGNRKMSLTLQRKTFTFTGLIAIDKNSPSRRTKLANETLYIVRSNNTSRTINYVMTTNAKKSDFVGIEPNWNTTIPLNNLYEGKVLTGINSTTGETRHTSESKGSVSAEAFEKTNSVNIEVVNFAKTKIDYVPPALNGALKKIHELTKKFEWSINKIFPACEDFKLEPKLNISGTSFNEEDKTSRFYYEVTSIESGFKLSFKTKCSKKILSLPLIPEKIDNWLKKYVQFEVYAQIAGNVSFSGKYDIKRRNDQKNKEEIGAFTGGVGADLEGGLIFDFLPAYQNERPFIFNLTGKAKSGADYKWTFAKNKTQEWDVTGKGTIKPLVFAGQFVIKTNKDNAVIKGLGIDISLGTIQ
jgi:archaellum component FlaC